jgi:signal transduction histidine kinase
MMYEFLSNNADDLIQRCIDKVNKRPQRNASREQLRTGIPMFLEQLTKTLYAEENIDTAAAIAISGASGGERKDASEMGATAAAHGAALLALDYTVDQVVHDYGDLCQAITDLAVERDAPFPTDEFRTLNRCLDNAIASAVTEFSFQRDCAISDRHASETNERLGFLMHELRNSLSVATMAVAAMEAGQLSISGATGALLKRGHAAMQRLINLSLEDVRTEGAASGPKGVFSLADFIHEARDSAQLDADTRGSALVVPDVDKLLAIQGDRDLLLAALANLLNNALKFTCAHTAVSLTAYAEGQRVLIVVRDHCGGLPAGNAEKMFSPFTQRGDDRSGLGLGLSIARQSISRNGGQLSVEDFPGVGCAFTMSLPRHLALDGIPPAEQTH